MSDKKYAAYLRSRYWRERSKKFKWDKHYVCEICGNHILMEVTEIIRHMYHPSWNIPEISRFVDLVMECKGDKDKLIQVHHRSYKNVGHELDSDLACVCRPCHVFLTENNKNRDLDGAWKITCDQVNGLSKQIKNTPDGEKEFASFIPYEEGKTNLDEDLAELKDDYYDFISDVYDTEDEFN